ncbi:hypothetical protein BKA65DRAFT_569481 [Rhexocercosporidium sp. MPI-PUGE-AT-0058]|nr:hypothetical protein BKA65DRAFT_569481 [Rhexocercosporidium sp. MPI-PUGE-AT-0058]
MAPAAPSICHLRQTLNPEEAWPLMGLTPVQVWEKMDRLLEALEGESDNNNDWIAATEGYYKNNGENTTYMNQPDSKQQSRDSDLLTMRYMFLNKTIFNGLFPPGTLNFHFILAGTPEWTKNREGLRLDGFTNSNRRELDTMPSNFIANVLIYEKPRIRCNDTRMKVLTGNLLHELVHAVLEAYACACRCCEKYILEGEGLTGHGTVWMAISRKVEKAMLRVFGYRCWLGRSQSLAHEHHAMRHRHTEKELKAYEVNEKLYCEARMDFGFAEVDKRVLCCEEDFAEKGDREVDFEGLESDYSEDEEEVDNPRDCNSEKIGVSADPDLRTLLS